MSQARNPDSKIASILAEAATKLPGVSESIACAGTALESKTFVVGKKSFVFIGSKDARLKLMNSLHEATELSAKHRDAVRVGTGGWVTIQLQADEPPSLSVLRRWVKESHGLFSPPSGQSPTSQMKPSRSRELDTFDPLITSCAPMFIKAFSHELKGTASSRR